MNFRENWRVLLLVFFLLASSFALLAPGVGGNSNQDGAVVEQGSDGPTNLQYGLELSGGTRIRAPVNGLTAEGVDIPQGTQPGTVERRVAGNLSGVTVSDVTARFPDQRGESPTVEVFGSNVTKSEFRSALDRAGYSYETVRQGVTSQTRDTIVRILSDKISNAGLSGGRVQQVTTANGENFVVIEMPNANRSQVEDLVTRRGKVQVVAHYPANRSGNTTEYRNTPLLTAEDFASIGTAETSRSGRPYVPVVLNNQAAQNFSNAMNQFGFTGQGVSSCYYPERKNDSGYCLYTVVDGEVVYGAGMGPNLAQTIRSGEFTQTGNFRMLTTNMSEARELQIHLNAGALPASLDMQAGTSYYLAPSLAEEFKLFSFITGLAAVLAVSGVVFLRYGDPKVAAPMLVTALSEVVILLGFAAAIGLPLDLSHIAGFIAVIGTGVDDLIIIADEVMSEGDVNSSRVFQSRFRKAFWVIGAAAATTIIAMSPLAVLSLGDLQGFAIVTILGVLIGVLVTRPAYGDILRSLLTDR
ncbi:MULTISPECIES: preprotein translocase subunit SecD [Halorussus]|uniref:preprotein translocase subunit SecD n=1 Tax=Halorussus TaxID=1070314 RepID=UPI0020A12C06|nr:preprotein translocase subunit SecD [Halorussus vallis]USZ77350.1 preprotein translocase subunit SecD [Halorussus vallis]